MRSGDSSVNHTRTSLERPKARRPTLKSRRRNSESGANPTALRLPVDPKDPATFLGCRCLANQIAVRATGSSTHWRAPNGRVLILLDRLSMPTRVRTTNLAELSFVEERRRTKVIGRFPDEKAAM